MTSWIVEVQEDSNGDAIIEIPPDALVELGWKEGDTIQWSDNKNGSFTLTKKEQEDEQLRKAESA